MYGWYTGDKEGDVDADCALSGISEEHRVAVRCIKRMRNRPYLRQWNAGELGSLNAF